MSVSGWALCVLPGVALTMTVVNALSWQRGKTTGTLDEKLSVLIPARNEATRLPAGLRALARSSVRIHEILVYDDDSTDDTPAVLAELSREIPQLRVIRGQPLPAGWVGKPHACHRLSQEATGDLLCFLDADVLVEPEGLARVASILRGAGADVVTAMPRQIMQTVAERLVVPFLLLSYVSWLPLELVPRTKDPRIVAANGQVLAVRRSALQRMGGFRAIAQEIVDDVAFCRRAKEANLRVVFADGTEIASCRMYATPKQVWEGFSKNIHEGVGSALALLLVVLVYLATFVAPAAAAIVASAAAPTLLVPASVATSLTVSQRALTWLRWRQPVTGLVTHPLGAIAVVAIALNSLTWSLRGEIKWAGRRYASRSARRSAA
ncbi:MAG: glycosyltransferase [Myxococcales bacterium]|nr:glycosyltransferase [Myxococcales bacterium]